MQALPRLTQPVLLSLLTIGSAALLGCPPANPGQTCPAEDPTAGVNVVGTYSYEGNPLTAPLVGTITFAQEGDFVTVTGTTYQPASPDRDLTGTGTLQGNVLNITLVPKDGTFYRATLKFVFSGDGNKFCVEFSDTNGDSGPLGSYRGQRQ